MHQDQALITMDKKIIGIKEPIIFFLQIFEKENNKNIKLPLIYKTHIFYF